MLIAATPNDYLEMGRCFFIDHFVSLVEIWCSEKLVSRFGFRVGEGEREPSLIKAMCGARASGRTVQKTSGLPTGGEARERREPPDNTQSSQGVADENVLPTD
ncbi:MAG: hypothetical protein VW599_11345 [Pseudomonadales bacterium]